MLLLLYHYTLNKIIVIIYPKPFSLLPIPNFNIKFIRITKKNIGNIFSCYNSENNNETKIKNNNTKKWWDNFLDIEKLINKNKKKTKNISSFMTDGIQLIICSECSGLDLDIKTSNKKINIKEILDNNKGGVWNSKNLYIDKNDYDNFEIIGFDPNTSNIGEQINGTIEDEKVKWIRNKNYKNNVSIGLWNSANGSIKNRNYDIIKKIL